ncbi:hypothetical protein BJX70DRAFT_24816 [Aspergillus crustosus]
MVSQRRGVVSLVNTPALLYRPQSALFVPMFKLYPKIWIQFQELLFISLLKLIYTVQINRKFIAEPSSLSYDDSCSAPDIDLDQDMGRQQNSQLTSRIYYETPTIISILRTTLELPLPMFLCYRKHQASTCLGQPICGLRKQTTYAYIHAYLYILGGGYKDYPFQSHVALSHVALKELVCQSLRYTTYFFKRRDCYVVILRPGSTDPIQRDR